MNLETAVCLLVSVIAICCCIGFVNQTKAEQETAKAAATAGLVQQVVLVHGYGTHHIWVKPPAPAFVEGNQ